MTITTTTTTTAHTALNMTDKAVRNARRELAERKRELRQLQFEQADAFDTRRAEVRVLLAEGRVARLEGELRKARRTYMTLAREVRVYNTTGKLLRVEGDKTRAAEAGAHEVAYEREAAVIAAKLAAC